MMRGERLFFIAPPLLTDEIHLSSQGGRVTIHAMMESIAPVEKVEVLSNGKVMETLALREDGKRAELTKEVEVSGSAWFTLRAYGTHPVSPVDDFYPFAETSPIYVDCGGRPIRSGEDARYFVTWIQAMSKMAAADPGWRSETEKSHVLGQFQAAQEVFEQRAVK